MVRFFLFILFAIISNNVIASVQGKTLICDKDSRGYKFISKDKVEVLSIKFDELSINSINHLYELAENVILIKKPLIEFNKNKNSKPIGWIFRRTLDYVSLDYVNGDWSRKFSWKCEVVSSTELDKRLKNTLGKLINFSKNNFNSSILKSHRIIKVENTKK